MRKLPTAVADALRHAQEGGARARTFTLENNTIVRVQLVPDEGARLEDDGDWFGALEWTREKHRPSQFDGAAEKIPTRTRETLWWQPPADAKADATLRASLRATIRDYYNDGWSYIGIVVELQSRPCAHCGERRTVDASLWRIESNATEYHAEVVADLLAECREALKSKKTH